MTLYRAGDSPVHRLPPEVKIVAAVLLTVAMVVTPREAFAAFGVYAGLIAVVAAVSATPAGWLLRRSTIELPFVIFAVVLPFTGEAPHTVVAGLALSVDGLYAGWNIVVKGTLGVLVSLLLAATTAPRDLIAGLERLRCPQIIVQIATFMLRYLAVLVEEQRRMRVARLSRGYDPRFLWQVRALASGIGALFLRAYERGERVYVAMLSRGYTGRLPTTGRPRASAAQWLVGLLIPAAATGVTLWSL